MWFCQCQPFIYCFISCKHQMNTRLYLLVFYRFDFNLWNSIKPICMPPVTGLRHIGLILDWSLLELTEDHVFLFWCGRLLVWCGRVYYFVCLFLRHTLMREILLLIILRPWTTQYGFVVISALINCLCPDFNLKDTAFQCSTCDDCLHVVITVSRCDFCQTAPSAGAHSKCQ